MESALPSIAPKDLQWLHRFATLLARDLDDADDLVQDTLLQAWRSAPADRGGSVRPWLATVMRNRFRQLRRGTLRRQHRERATATVEDARPPETEHARLEVLRILLDAIGKLPDVDQKIIVRRFLDDESAAEVGRDLAMPAATVRTRTRRSMQRLKQSLDRRYGDRAQWCAAVAAVPIPEAAGTSTATPGSSMSITIKIAALAGIGAMGLAGYALTDDRQSTEAPTPSTATAAPAKSDPAAGEASGEPPASTDADQATPARARWDARREAIRRALPPTPTGRAPESKDSTPSDSTPSDDNRRDLRKRYHELVDGCLADLGPDVSGTLTVSVREIGAPDVGTIYDNIEVAHHSLPSDAVLDCLVQSMHAVVGEPPDEPYEREISITMPIGKPVSRPEADAQVASYIVGAHISEVRACGKNAGDPAGTVSFRLKVGEDGLLSASVRGGTELPDGVVDCIEAATLRWKFPKTLAGHDFDHEFVLPVPGRRAGE